MLLDRSPAVSSLSEMVRSTELQIDIRTLSATVMALAWRSVEVCHWADGYPLNVHLYLSLLRAVFDLRDDTVLLDEVDELLELIKKSWNMLGLNRMIHNVCFTWVLFERYVTTGQIEPDLMSATLVMLRHVSEDAMNAEQEPGYSRVLSATLASVYSWAENKLMDYHEAFDNTTMKNVVTLAVLAAEMLSQHIPAAAAGSSFTAGADLIDCYIKSSARHAFAKLDASGDVGGNSMMVEVEDDPRETLMYVAAQTKEIARVEKDVYAPILRQWHPCPSAIAAVTLHACFGTYFKRFVSNMDGCLSSESMCALQTASDLDKYLVQMAHDDDGAGHGSKQMIPYDVDSIVVDLVTEWMDDRLRIGVECVRRARDSETWNPGSKSEPYAQSAVDLMKLAKVTVDVLMEIHQRWPMSEPLQYLADGIDRLVHQYSSFLASSCGAGTKEGYIPQLPPLTRCGQDKRLLHQLLLNLNCVAGGGNGEATVATAARAMARVRPTTSGATQRLYVRLNTLHYMLGVLHSIDRSLAPRGQQRHIIGHRRARSSSFDRSYPAVEAAIVHVTELSGYRLVFLDSAHYFHQALYQGGVAGARIGPALRIMKQNLAFLCSVVSDRAQPLAVREAMNASIEAFLIALLAGGSERAFSQEDGSVVVEDLASLKGLFCSCGEGLVTKEVVEMEFAAAEGVVDLMGLPTEKLIDEFLRSSSGCTTTILPMTRRWIWSDANTLLRVLCHRDDEAASRFLKKTFDLPKRR